MSRSNPKNSEYITNSELNSVPYAPQATRRTGEKSQKKSRQGRKTLATVGVNSIDPACTFAGWLRLPNCIGDIKALPTIKLSAIPNFALPGYCLVYIRRGDGHHLAELHDVDGCDVWCKPWPPEENAKDRKYHIDSIDLILAG